MFYLTQAGTDLQVLDADGVIQQTLTLPSGVTLDATKRGRFAILGQQIVLVNSPTQNLWIDPTDFTVRAMGILPPIGIPTVAAGSGTGLTGGYRVKVSFAIKNEDGTIINESPLGPQSASVTLANNSLDISNIPVSVNSAVNCRRIYRTVADGSIFFAMFDLDDNETTAVSTAMTDAALELLPADTELGNPPGTLPGTALSLIVAWRNRLWARSANVEDGDQALFSDFDRFYAWSIENELLANPVGEDKFGIVAYMPRRDELVMLKRRRVMKITGFSEDDFEVITVAEGVGCIATESVVVVRDVGYWLGPDGVYSYGPDGVAPISDNVKPWFQTDTYFDRTLFPDAVGSYNPFTDCYELQIGTQWVSYDIRRKEWLGIHATSKFTPTVRALLSLDSGELRPTVASADGYLYQQNQAGAADGGDTGIAISWKTKAFAGQNPKAEKFWGKPTVYLKRQSATAGDITVTPQVGDYGAVAGDTLALTQQQDQVELDRLGEGRIAQLTFAHSLVGEDVDLHGFELPFSVVGQRPNPR
jgi:hypothetical protein